MKEELAGIERYRGPKERSLDQYASSLEAMQTTKEGLESELHQVWLIIKSNICTNFSNLFLEGNYMFRTVPLSIISSFSLYTQQWYMSYRFANSLQAGSGCSILILLQAVSKPVWHILLLCVQWETPDDGQRNCPKHVEFPSKNKFEESVQSSWFYYKKFITMHGHMNVRIRYGICIPSSYLAWACSESIRSSFLDLRSVTVHIRRLNCMVWVATPLVCQKFFFKFASLQQLEINYILFHIVSVVHS